MTTSVTESAPWITETVVEEVVEEVVGEEVVEEEILIKTDLADLIDEEMVEEALEEALEEAVAGKGEEEEEEDGEEEEAEEEEGQEMEEEESEELVEPSPKKARGDAAIELYEGHEQSMALIRAVGSREKLFNGRSGAADLQTRLEKKKLWECVSEETNLPVAECKSRWTHLRNDFRVKLNAYEATGREYYKDWYYYQHLVFLEPCIRQHRRVNTNHTSSKKPLPKRRCGLPPKLHDYVSNDYMTQLDIAEKKRSKSNHSTSVQEDSRLSDGSSSSSSDNDSNSSSSGSSTSEEGSGDETEDSHTAAQIQKLKIKIKNTKKEAYNGSRGGTGLQQNNSSPVKRKRGRPFSVKYKNVASSTPLLKRKPGRPFKDRSKNLAALLSLNNSLDVISKTLGEDLSNSVNTLEKSLNRKTNNDSSINSDPSIKRKRGRPRIHPIKPPSLIKRGRGRPPRILDSVERRSPDGTSSGDERVLLVTITDTTRTDRIFSQKISYAAGRKLNLEGFDARDWMGEEESSYEVVPATPSQEEELVERLQGLVEEVAEKDSEKATEEADERLEHAEETTSQSPSRPPAPGVEEPQTEESAVEEEFVTETHIIYLHPDAQPVRAVSHLLTEEEITGGFTCQSLDLTEQ